MYISHFQSLPWVLMKSILEYVACDQSSAQQSSAQVTAVALLSTCHSWRAFVISSLCSEYNISIDRSYNAVTATLPRWPKQMRAPSLPSTGLVKKLRVSVVQWCSVINGSALEIFACSELSKTKFLAAHTLAVSVVDVAGIINCSTEEVDRAIEFTKDLSRLIRSMVPGVRQVDISWPNLYHVGLKKALLGFMNNATGLLYTGVRRVSFTEYGGLELPSTIQPSGQTDITHLSFRSSLSASRFTGLARACSRSLVELVIHEFPKDPTGLLYDENNTSVVYSSLQKLYIAQAIGIQGLVLPKTQNVTHFPRLRSLEINCQYPFGDDVLLRNNADTIEHICIPLDREFMHMNAKSNIFTPDKFKHLRSIKLLNYYGAQEMSQDDIDSIDRFVFSVSRSAAGKNLQIVRWGGLSDRKRLLYGLTHNQKLSNLRTVELSQSIFDFSEIIAILKAIPYLQRLWFSLDNNKHSVDGVVIPKLPSHLVKTHFPVGKHLNSVTFDKESKASVKQMAEAAMMLVLVSPSLVLSSVYTGKYTGFYSAIGCAMAKDPFKKFAHRLCPLANACY
ncbi:hypothetical protein H4R99_003923 [Coemansia sp. RSA 1722]|nr:hypothetical protein LPJ57_002350 [Coemansia sp. RSA 486]KAJ2598909.1 hypothetical protein H4R99_003923 [Coemansia sp. RSA 1722]KAJ2635399.1 hypothetical protein GGF40_003643 [Coemansia sp. RSA 1286]